MPQIVCENCRKKYDYDRDEFCPRCGAYNQPVKTWGVDAQGNAVRVDGINEQTHAESFVHREIHKEKAQRSTKGLDWKTADSKAKPTATEMKRADSNTRTKGSPQVGKLVAIIIGVIIAINFIIPLLISLFSMF